MSESPLVPEGFSLKDAKNSYSTTDHKSMERCPEGDCDSIKIRKKRRSPELREHPEPYYCENCGTHFETPRPPKCKTESDE